MARECDIDPALVNTEPSYQTCVSGYIITVPNETEQISKLLNDHQRINQFHFSFTTFRAELVPFAKGGERIAYRALNSKNERIVLKRFFQPRSLRMFTSRELDNHILNLDQAENAVAKTQRTPNFVEPYLHGYFIKYIDNNGWINEQQFHSTLHAFAHWTWVHTKGTLLICDIQGVSGTNKFYLTDPALHHIDTKKFMFSDTNLGNAGITKFFSTHQCNAICLGLNLPKHKAQMLPDTMKGTTINPNVDARVKQLYQKTQQQTPRPKQKPLGIQTIVTNAKMKPSIGSCVALFPYTAANDKELTLHIDDVIEIVHKSEGWWVGKKDNKVGLLPSNYVQELLEKYLFVAVKDFVGSRGMLSLKKGDKIYLLAKSGDLYKAVKGAHVGFIPKVVCTKLK
ncbi:Elongation factor 2 kinase [Entamoeba marina]